MATEEKKAPTSLKRGMPPEQANGLFGAEERIMLAGVKSRFQAVVTFEVADVVHSEADGTRRPVVELAHIEPIWDAAGIEAVKASQESSYKERTGANQLNFDGIADEPKDDEGEAGEQ